jgi:hypothetical protein
VANPHPAIHSSYDKVMPFGPTQLLIEEMRRAGWHAELITLNGITHYQTLAHRYANGLTCRPTTRGRIL